MLDAGDPAPDFSLSRVDDHYATYMLSAAAKEGPVVLAFFPGDAGDARPMLSKLAGIDWGSLIDSVAVFAIGTDEGAGQHLVADLSPPFPVLQDRDSYVTDLYEVAQRADGSGPQRTLVVADQSCTIDWRWTAADPTESVPVAELESAVAALARD
jgi:peroxiredoxin